jgi:hypothetical protein
MDLSRIVSDPDMSLKPLADFVSDRVDGV